MTVFGEIVTGPDVERAVTETVKLWASTYLGEVAVRSGRERGALPSFRGYTTALELDKYEGEQLPLCVVTAPGLLEVPERHANGYRATWGLGLGAVVRGQDKENTYQLCGLYAAALRALILQHPSLGGFSGGVDWIGERYDELGDEDMRTIAAGIVQFAVDVETALDPLSGPALPIDGEPDDVATIETVTVLTGRLD